MTVTVTVSKDFWKDDHYCPSKVVGCDGRCALKLGSLRTYEGGIGGAAEHLVFASLLPDSHPGGDSSGLWLSHSAVGVTSPWL